MNILLDPNAPITDAGAPPSEVAPPTPPPEPSIADVSEYDSVSTYQPTFKQGTTIVTGQILDFGPAVNQEDGTFNGWRISFALTEPAPDDSGGQLPVGHRCGPFTIFTQPSQYRTSDQCKQDGKINLQGLNGIVRDKRNDPRFDKADGAFKALDASKKLPGLTDTTPAHYEQWKGTVCKFVVTNKNDRVNLNAIMAAGTPEGSVRR